MYIKETYLVQRGVIRELASPETRLSNAVNLDYMGSSEFEFGALPSSLRALQSSTILARIVEKRIMKDDAPLRVVHTFTPEQYEEYFKNLVSMREGKQYLKERSGFSIQEESNRFNNANFWWDIENHVMFSFNKMFMNRLPDFLMSSWKYMDEQKAK